MENNLPSWICQACGKIYFDDNFQKLGCKCTECGAEYKFCFTVTKTTHNDDGTITDEIIHQQELK
jgi:DNA-directed RNA polymerase subunit RPC12/RpoP